MVERLDQAATQLPPRYIPASVWQMLRGATIVFSVLFSIVFLDRQACSVLGLGQFCHNSELVEVFQQRPSLPVPSITTFTTALLMFKSAFHIEQISFTVKRNYSL
jgi:hypothetical protein